jgi:polysaccharide biosynthesis protein PslH
MRAKLLEGIALGRVILSTSVGMEGIPVVPYQTGLIADTPEEWAQAIGWCVQHPELIRVGQQARQFCADTFDCSVIARRLVDTYNNMVERSVEMVG